MPEFNKTYIELIFFLCLYISSKRIFNKGVIMLKIQQVKAIRYAIVNHFKGWQLLKNPEGVSGTTVRMIRESESIDSRTLDTFYTTSRVTADFSKPATEITNENLYVNNYNFYNAENQLKDTRRYVTYIRNNPDGKRIVKGKGNVSDETLAGRNFDSLHVPNITKLETPITPLSNDFNNGYYVSPVLIPIKRSFAYIQKEAFKTKALNKFFTHSPKRSFWKTLWHNLKQG